MLRRVLIALVFLKSSRVLSFIISRLDSFIKRRFSSVWSLMKFDLWRKKVDVDLKGKLLKTRSFIKNLFCFKIVLFVLKKEDWSLKLLKSSRFFIFQHLKITHTHQEQGFQGVWFREGLSEGKKGSEDKKKRRQQVKISFSSDCFIFESRKVICHSLKSSQDSQDQEVQVVRRPTWRITSWHNWRN